MCNWKSSLNPNLRCNRANYNNTEFCLFHLTNKSDVDSELFWKIINWNLYSGLNSQEINLLFKPWMHQENRQAIENINNKIQIAILQNFSKEEREREDFPNFKRYVENQVACSQIWLHNHSSADFKGFVFPKVDIHYFRFNLAISDNGFGEMDFTESVFEGPIVFDNFIFNLNTRFDSCNFKNSVRFCKSRFLRFASFKNVYFSNNYLGTTRIFEQTEFLGSEVVFENNRGNTTIDFKGIIFGPYTNFVLTKMNFGNEYGNASFGEDAYRIAKIQAYRIGDTDTGSKYFYDEKCFKGFQILPTPYYWDTNEKGIKKFKLLEYLSNGKTYSKIIPKIIDQIAKHGIGYGEKPLNALISTIAIIFVFAVLHLFIGGIKVNNVPVCYQICLSANCLSSENMKIFFGDFLNSLYFSVVTFTTVGYGDITPCDGVGKLLSGLEMFLGVTFVGAWTATLLRKFIN